MERVVPDTQVLGTHSAMEKWVESKSNKFFFIFCQILAILDDFSNHQIWKKFGNK